MPSLSCLLPLLALTILRSAQAQSNGAEVPFALQSPGKLTQCKNTTVVWQGGQSPYKVTFTPICGAGKNASAETHEVVAPGSTSVELPIRFASGTPLIVSITDSTNMQATAPQSVVTSGNSDDSCTIQTACIDAAQAPDSPNAIVGSASQSTSTGFPTDYLITADPSATSIQTPSVTEASSSESTMVIVYSYVSQTSTPSATAESTLQSQANTAISSGMYSTPAVLGSMVLLGTTLAFDLW
ncbi:hypothetical protein RSOL_208890, partial [Rhizoctonia solani AG-3 Rhs1AP]